MMTLTLFAPLSGRLTPLAQISDPTFSQKLAGEGIAIDPVDAVLLAPTDGEIIDLAETGHNVTMRTDDGIELMLHIGQDTVMLRGKGFTPKVQRGDWVQQGDPLIAFDVDVVKPFAASLLTTLIITNSQLVTHFDFCEGDVIAGRDPIMILTLDEAMISTPPLTVSSEPLTVPNLLGLHARPASVLAYLARKFDSDVRIEHKGRQANAKSVFGIMNLCIMHNDPIQVIARGPDAEEAIQKIAPRILQGLGEDIGMPAYVPPAKTIIIPPTRAADPNLLVGIPASPGIVVGEIFQMRQRPIEIRTKAKKRKKELRLLDEAIEKAKVQLEALQARLHHDGEGDKAAIFAAHEALLDDPELLDLTIRAIDHGDSAAVAWQAAYTKQADRLAQLKNVLFASRADDLRDVGLRVLRNLAGVEPEPLNLSTQTILVAEDLSLSEVADLDPTYVSGFCTTQGGASSHLTIMAHSLDIPAVIGIDPKTLEVANGTTAILDGARGTLRLNPVETRIAQVRRQQEQAATIQQINLQHADEPAVTIDGYRLVIGANVGSLAEVDHAVHMGCEGIGLLRSEFLFLEFKTMPSEDEQQTAYRDMALRLGDDRPLIIRTLDIGADKPSPYLPIPTEDNPFLGERGIRVSLSRPGILRTQLRAILRASTVGKVRVMFPMIATLTEWRAAKAMLEQERRKLGVEPIPAGIMVEVPAAAITAAKFANEVDFFSIGTNDLTQYTLAMDRGHPKLAPQVDSLSPSVLMLIKTVVDAAHERGKWVGVCGAVAADPQAVPLLVGLGVDELSMSVPSIPRIKAQIRQLNQGKCQTLAKKALSLDTATEIRALN
ncbi:MAG TPA: phosphoenolpyruvate--protein phosphotransferase [Anaerolineae bacterium]|nr:phosphoenolpyruvate--protein phosphotransferase [Anaerolineae bacterium]MCB9107811.1 phosphoenolpyruvate--protein phosphotransferase [Anaerolineales bacterium]HRV95271.1 phosphoenolpyruvate--protein phosphotransferase [Anaerolineae bacterium]